MHTAWRGTNPLNLPAGIPGTARALEALWGALSKGLVAAQGGAQALAQVSAQKLSPAQLALQQTVQLLAQNLELLRTDAGLYVLPVPVKKRVVIPPLVQATLETLGLPGLPAFTVENPLVQLQAQVEAQDAGAAGYLARAAIATAGNAGFLRQVAESFVDAGDAQRPQLLETDYVWGVCLMAGASDLTDILPALQVLGTLASGGTVFNPLLPAPLPVPTGLRARLVQTAEGWRHQLEWEPQPVLHSTPALNLQTRITQVALVRSREVTSITAATPLEVFGTTQLTSGLTQGGYEVVAVEDYGVLGPTRCRVVPPPGEAPCYYRLCYGVRAGSPADVLRGEGKDLGFGAFGGHAKVETSAASALLPAATSTRPDWVRTPSVQSLCRPAGDFLQDMEGYVRRYDTQADAFVDMLRTHTSFLGQQVQRGAQVLASINARLSVLQALQAVALNAGVHQVRFRGRGGVTRVLTELSHALSPSNRDVKRPPYDGDEFTAGILILAAGPSEAVIEPTRRLYELFFGGDDGRPGTHEVLAPLLEEAPVTPPAAPEDSLSGSTVPTLADFPGGRVPVATGEASTANCPQVLPDGPTLGDDMQPIEG